MTDDTEDLGDFESGDDDQPPAPHDPLADDFQTGDPCIDLATGRAVVVVDVPGQTVMEWSADNGYSLLANYANQRCRAHEDDPVVECVYVASVRSEPNGPRGSDEGGYTFPSSRLARVTIESIDGVRRVYDAVAVDVLRQLYRDLDPGKVHEDYATAQQAFDIVADDLFGFDMTAEALELAKVELQFGEAEDDA